MSRATSWRGLPSALAGVLACIVAPLACADVTATIDVTGLRVAVVAVAPGAVPAVSFVGAGGSTSESDVTAGAPPSSVAVSASSGRAFGPASTATPASPLAGGSARLDGNVFGGGGDVHASAFASSAGPGETGQGTVGLVDGVSATAFTLSPWTRMTITAQVSATASATGTAPDEFADSGLLLSISDGNGGGPQWQRISFDAFALGLFGAVSDTEATFVSLSYENDTGAPLTGLFGGYVAAIAYSDDPPVSPVPEAGPAWTMGAGLLLVAVAARRRRGAPAQ